MPKPPASEVPVTLSVVPPIETLDPRRGLTTKLSEILGIVGRLEKKGENKSQGYRFAREGDLVDMIRPLLAERHLFLHQSVANHEIRELYVSRGGATMWLTILHVEFWWADGDTDSVPMNGRTICIGYGADSGDKGVYKALTGAGKYFLMKTFLISTGDDPEADEKVDKEAEIAGAARGSRTAGRGATRTTQAGTTRGGRSANTSNPQLAEMGRLARQLGWHRDALVAFVGKVIGEDLAALDNEAFAEHMGTLEAEAMGKVIVAMSEALPPEETASEPSATEPVVEEDDTLDIGGDTPASGD